MPSTKKPILRVPFFFFNIVGEELKWRGYLLRCQELCLTARAWRIDACLWTMFHLCSGWPLMMILSPILFIPPYIVQKRQTTWIGIFIHAAVNGPVILLLALHVS